MLESERNFHELVQVVFMQKLLIEFLALVLFKEQEQNSCQVVRVFIGQSVMAFSFKASLVTLHEETEGKGKPSCRIRLVRH